MKTENSDCVFGEKNRRLSFGNKNNRLKNKIIEKKNRLKNKIIVSTIRNIVETTLTIAQRLN
jgi:hypothetical protein